MASKKPSYPFIAKTTAYLTDGDFWSIPLSDGRFACGRVLQVTDKDGDRHRNFFGAGLMDWIESAPPTANALSGHVATEQARCYVEAIALSPLGILGNRPLHLDGITLVEELAWSPVNNVPIVRGIDLPRRATNEEKRTLPMGRWWYKDSLQELAERKFVQRLPIEREIPWKRMEELYDLATHQEPDSPRTPLAQACREFLVRDIEKTMNDPQ